MAVSTFSALLFGLIGIPLWAKILAAICLVLLALVLGKNLIGSSGTGGPRKTGLQIAFFAICAFAVWFAFSGFHDAMRDRDDPGYDTIAVQVQDTFIGSDIVFCVANVEADVKVDLPIYKLGPLFNSSNIKFNALGRYPVGIDKFGAYVRQTWQAKPTEFQTPTGTKKAYAFSVTLPSPEIIGRYSDATLYSEGTSTMTPDEAKEAYGVAYASCRGTSKFHDASGGGALTRIKKVFDSGSSEYNKAREKALKIAYQRATDPNDRSFGGMSAMEQARENTRQKVEDLIRAIAQDEIAELEKKGYVVLVVVNFDDTIQLDEPDKAEPTSYQVAARQ